MRIKVISEAVSVDDGTSVLLVLVISDPHVVERLQIREDRST